MIDQICTPVVNDVWAVLRRTGGSPSPTFNLLTGSTSAINSLITVPKDQLIKELTMKAFCEHGVAFSETDDATIAWHLITHAVGEIALGTRRIGGTTVVVTQEMHDFLAPFKPLMTRLHWVVDESAPSDSALITYHGISDSDGGFPCEEHSDGTVTIYHVDPLDIQYYRLVLIAIPTNDQNVYLNWSR